MKILNYENPGVRWRVFEKEYLEKKFDATVETVTDVKDIGESDVMIWRPNTEFTTFSDIEKMIETESKSKFHINKPSSFIYSHAKDAAFDKWRENNIPCPKHFNFESKEEFIDKLENSDIQYPFLIRINNENTGKGSWLVKEEAELDLAIKHCLDLMSIHRMSVPTTNSMCIELVDTLSGRNYNHSFRIIVAGNKVISGYARLSSKEDWVAITAKFRPEMRDDFIEWNKKCEKFCVENEEMLVRSVRCLGLNHQGIDVIFGQNDKPYFLEVQPGYSTGYSDWSPPFYNPYYPELVDFLLSEKELLEKEIPMYYNRWLQKERLFNDVWTELRRDYEAHIH